MPRSLSIYLEAVPWLMLAEVGRIVYITEPPSWHIFIGANVAIVIAFLIVSRRTIELAGGQTRLGGWQFDEQLWFACRVLLRIAVLAGAGIAVALLLGQPYLAQEILFGFDSMAFDGTGLAQKGFAALFAVLIFLMALQQDRQARISLVDAARELVARWRYLVPALIAVTTFLIGFSEIQGEVREPVRAFWTMPDVNIYLRVAVFFPFVFIFATIRLWVVVRILTFALRSSYMDPPTKKGAPGSAPSNSTDRA